MLLLLQAALSQPLSTTHFDGFEDWQLIKPGDVELNNSAIEDIRITFDAPEMGGPGGVGFRLYLDVTEVMFKGREAIWVQWLFSHPKQSKNGVPAIDILVMDKITNEYYFRLQPNGAGPDDFWAGPYGFVQSMPGLIREVRVDQEGNANADSTKTNRPIFDFATLGFLFPFMDLTENSKFLVERYHSPTRKLGKLACIVKDEVELQTAGGKVLAIPVEVMPESRSSIVTYFVTKEAPYFYGWDYKTVANGVSVFKMNYIEHIITRKK